MSTNFLRGIFNIPILLFYQNHNFHLEERFIIHLFYDYILRYQSRSMARIPFDGTIESVARKCILHLESIDRGRIKSTFKEAVDT